MKSASATSPSITDVFEPYAATGTGSFKPPIAKLPYGGARWTRLVAGNVPWQSLTVDAERRAAETSKAGVIWLTGFWAGKSTIASRKAGYTTKPATYVRTATTSATASAATWASPRRTGFKTSGAGEVAKLMTDGLITIVAVTSAAERQMVRDKIERISSKFVDARWSVSNGIQRVCSPRRTTKSKTSRALIRPTRRQMTCTSTPTHPPNSPSRS